MNFLNGGAQGGEAVRCSAWLDHVSSHPFFWITTIMFELIV